MSRVDKRVWAASWLAPVGWTAAAVLLALSLLVPVPTIEPRIFVWALGLSLVVAALGHLLHPHRHPSGRHAADAAPRAGWRSALGRVATRLVSPRLGRGYYRGHRNASGRPRFD